MQAALKDKNDIKIFILFLMKNIGYPLDCDTLNDVVVQDGVVSYFDFVECFAELLDTGNVSEVQKNDETYYEITEQGVDVVDSLEGNLLGILRDKSLKSALRLLSFKKRGSEIKCNSSELEDGRFKLTCSVVEHRDEVLKIDLVVDNKVELEKMKYNFNDKPEVCYRGILAVLSGDVNYLLS